MLMLRHVILKTAITFVINIYIFTTMTLHNNIQLSHVKTTTNISIQHKTTFLGSWNPGSRIGEPGSPTLCFSFSRFNTLGTRFPLRGTGSPKPLSAVQNKGTGFQAWGTRSQKPSVSSNFQKSMMGTGSHTGGTEFPNPLPL